jgi:uncharacterized membrane protein HdeD (DUF308 family)
MAERIWILIAGVLVILAGVFVWRNRFSAAFVIAALGGCAWFLSYRAQLRARYPASDEGSISVDEEQ